MRPRLLTLFVAIVPLFPFRVLDGAIGAESAIRADRINTASVCADLKDHDDASLAPESAEPNPGVDRGR
jgi:hypothetical protein